MKDMKPKALMLASVASMIDQFNMPNIQILQSLGYRVDVAADFTDPGTITRTRADYVRRQLGNLDVRVFDIAIPRNLNPKAILTAYRKVKKLIETEQYTVLHCHSPIGGAIAREAAKNSRKGGLKVIYTAHGFHFYKGAALKNWILFYPIEKLLSKYTDVLITITKEDYKRALKKFFAQKVEYIPGVGVDTERFHPSAKNRAHIREELNIAPDRIMLLSVGELNKNKNHEAVIRALKGADITYVIVGKGNLSTHLEETAREVGTDLRLMGFRSNVTDYYNAADAFVLPSLREGLNVSLMEAMASGLSCSCGRIRGNTDLIEDTSCLFDPSDPDQIREAIQYVITYREVLGARNRKKITAFSKTAVAKKMKHIYSDVCEDR